MEKISAMEELSISSAQEKQDVEENPVTPDGSGNHDDPDQKEPIAEVEAETEVEPIVEVEAEYSGKLQNAQECFHQIFAQLPESKCKIISRLEREDKELPSRSLVYGEIIYETIERIFEKLKTDCQLFTAAGGNFYDIGSGSGKVVMAATLLHDFDKCVGIEILDGLYNLSLDALRVWNLEVLDTLPIRKGQIDIKFSRDDAVEVNWSDATLVFCNATCFTNHLMKKLSKASNELAVGTYFVSIGKPLDSNRWKICSEERYDMSWGSATVLIQKKLV